MLAYLKMLARNRIAGFKPQSIGKAGEKKAKTVLKYVGFAFLALYLYAVVLFLEILIYNTGAEYGQRELLIAVLFLGCTFVTLMYSFFYIISILFFAKDTSFLAAMPISSRAVMASKICIVAAGEVGLTLLIGAPILVRYGVEMGAGVGYYLRALIGTIFVPLAPIALSTLLACLLIRVSALWKRRESMTIVMSFAFMIAMIAFQMNMNLRSSEGEMSAIVMNFLFNKGSLTDVVLNAYPPLRWLVTGITDSGLAAWGSLALFAAVSAGVIALVVFAFGGSYMRLALKQQESIRRENAVRHKLGRDHVRSPFWALYRQEMREVITVPVYATNCLTGVVLFPVMIVFMMVGFKDRIPGGDFVGMLLSNVPAGYMTAILSGALSLTTVMGMAVSTAVSREGKQHDMRKTFPVSGFTHLSAKLWMGVTYNAVATLTSAIALWVLLPMLWLQTLVGLAVSQLFSLLVCLMGLLYDTYHAKLEWKTETEAVKQNMNSLLSMLMGIVALAALVGAFVLCTSLHLSAGGSFAIALALIAVGDLLLFRWLKGKASSAYYVV